MKNLAFVSFKMVLIMTALTGILYPVVMTAIGGVAFTRKAEGSFLSVHGRVIGSELIAQKFVSERYFWPRPSAIDYNPLPSGGSNLGPTNKDLRKLVQDRRVSFASSNGFGPDTFSPNDMIFASGSGLDPHISPEAALLQVGRVVRARGLDNVKKERLLRVISELVESPQFGILGNPRVNVLRLNVALDEIE